MGRIAPPPPRPGESPEVYRRRLNRLQMSTGWTRRTASLLLAAGTGVAWALAYALITL